jgi:hypothetical protein
MLVGPKYLKFVVIEPSDDDDNDRCRESIGPDFNSIIYSFAVAHWTRVSLGEVFVCAHSIEGCQSFAANHNVRNYRKTLLAILNSISAHEALIPVGSHHAPAA